MHKDIRSDVADIMRRLYERGLTTCSGGNVSCRDNDNRIFITPSQIDKGRITAEQIAEIDKNGKLITDKFKPSMETAMHLAVYKLRPDINAVVHAHPPKATAWACSDTKLENNLCGEARYFLGEIGVAPYHLMGTDNLAKSTAKSLSNSFALLLKNHGALTVGKTLFEAYDRMEVLESLADLQINVRQTGDPRYLSHNELRKIDKMRDL